MKTISIASFSASTFVHQSPERFANYRLLRPYRMIQFRRGHKAWHGKLWCAESETPQQRQWRKIALRQQYKFTWALRFLIGAKYSGNGCYRWAHI